RAAAKRRTAIAEPTRSNLHLMEMRQLGNSDLMIAPIGVGAWAMGGGGWAFSWGPQNDEASIAAIHRALDSGLNWIDTAAVYGLGHSEEVVGRALRERQDRPYVFTKCERVWDEKGVPGRCLQRDSIRRECEDSLRRLGVDVIDLYQIHWPQPDEDIEEGWTALQELKAEGKIRWAGVCNFSVTQLRRAQQIAPVTSLQPPYHMLRREIEAELLPYAQSQGIGVIVYSPMASGLLSGGMTREKAASMASDDWRRGSEDFTEPILSRNLELVDRLREVGDRHGRTPGEVAIAWTLRLPSVTGAIVGVRSPEQVEGVIGAVDFRLSGEEVSEVEEALKRRLAR
ncbi:MAG TPA: aldo/keto reductase, partial [Fimbriimonas sp.]